MASSALLFLLLNITHAKVISFFPVKINFQPSKMENNTEHSVIWLAFASSCHITLLYQQELKSSDDLQQ
jgi:hypothetical protein